MNARISPIVQFCAEDRGSVQPRTMMIMGLALAFGVSSSVGVRAYLNDQGASINNVVVVIAAVDIPRGRVISTADVATREFPRDMVPDAALMKVADAVDRVASIPMIKGEPVLGGKLAAKGSGRGLAALVPRGMRAVTIQTPNVATGVAGLIVPGNKVDVMLTVTESGNASEFTGGGSATTLLQRVEILAVDQRVDTPAESTILSKESRSVTLLVTPQQANLLDLAQNKGILHLSLRNHDDADDSKVRPVTLTDLRFHQEKPWDERVKGIIESLARAKQATVLAEASKPASPPPLLRIRTIRGANEGSVYVQSATPSPADRASGRPEE